MKAKNYSPSGKSCVAGQKALEYAKAGGSWSDPTWETLADVETNVTCTAIYGYKFKRG